MKNAQLYSLVLLCTTNLLPSALVSALSTPAHLLLLLQPAALPWSREAVCGLLAVARCFMSQGWLQFMFFGFWWRHFLVLYAEGFV